MNNASSLKNICWKENGLKAQYTAMNPGFGIKNDNGQFLSRDGIKPCSYGSKAIAAEMAPYADDFENHTWVEVG